MKNLLAFCSNKRKIVCYGAGLYGKIVRTFLHENGIEIECFAVTHLSGKDEQVLGIQVKQLDELEIKANSSEYGILVCASQAIAHELIEELYRRGVEDYYLVDDHQIGRIDEACTYRDILSDSPKILLYHRVSSIEPDIWKLSNSKEIFREQIEFLKDYYNIEPYESLWKNRSPRSIAVTFDDGYADNYYNALPILEEYNAPATVFVCSGNIDSDDEFWWDAMERMIVCNRRCPENLELLGNRISLTNEYERTKACYDLRKKVLLMNYVERTEFFRSLGRLTRDSGEVRREYRTLTSAELKEFDQSPLITIGGHTVTHTRLTSETVAEQREEIAESKRIIENIVGHTIDCFSYPFGEKEDYDSQTIQLTREAGYKNVAAVRRRFYEPEMDLYNHGRIGIWSAEPGPDNIREVQRALVLGE